MDDENQVTGEQNRYGIKDLLTIVFKHKLKIAVVFSVVVTAVTLGTFLLTPVYEAKSSLLIKIGREYLNRSEIGETRTALSVNQEEVNNSEIQIMTNHDLIRRVIATLTLEKVYPDLAKNPPPKGDVLEIAATAFEKRLSVEGIKKSSVLRVSFQHQDPLIAAQAVNTLVELFKEKHLQVFSDPKSSFLEQQLEAYKQRLKESENNLQAFKQKNKVYSIEEQRTLLLKQRADLDTALKNSEFLSSELQKKVSHLRNQMQAIANDNNRYTHTDLEKIIVDAKGRLLSLELEERELLKRYKENNYFIMNLRKKIELVKRFISEQESETYQKVKSSNIIYQNVEMDLLKAETELTSQRGRISALKGQLSQLNQDIEILDFSGKQLQELRRELLINEKNYHIYAGKTEEARISEDMDRLKLANISVIHGAAVPVLPVKPNKGLNILIGIVAGGIAGLAVAFFAESTAQSISSPGAAERRLGLPVLTSVSFKET